MRNESSQTVIPAWPFYDDDEIAAGQRVLASGKVNYWTGEQGVQFEKEFADYVGCPHALTVTNGTVALELALRLLGVGPGDEVVTSSRTFIASASCAVAVGARPVCADVDPVSQNITAETIRSVLSPATRAVIAVHLAGWPCEMDPIMALAREHGLKVVEDCAQAHGARLDGRPVGSMGDIGAFSFCQDKILSTGGEGGILTLNSAEHFERARSYRDHGKDFPALAAHKGKPGFPSVYHSFGSNLRLTEFQSAIGRRQLTKLDRWVEIRRHHAAALNACFSQLPALRITLPTDRVRHSYYKHYVFLHPERLRTGWNRDRIISALQIAGVPCSIGSCSEIYLEQAFPPEWRPTNRFPVARELGETSLMFPVHPTLSTEDIQRFCDAVSTVMQSATR